MKDFGNVLIIIGILIYVLYSVVDRFFYRVPNVVAYIVMGLGLLCLFIGIVT